MPLKTRLTERLGIRYPILNAAMGGTAAWCAGRRDVGDRKPERLKSRIPQSERPRTGLSKSSASVHASGDCGIQTDSPRLLVSYMRNVVLGR